MPTTALPTGRKTRHRATYETTLGVNPGSAFSELHVYSSEITPVQPLVDDDVLGAGYANPIDDRPAAPSVSDPTWKASVPLDLSQIGFWLGAALGRVSATGTTPKTHLFSSGGLLIPTLSLEKELVAGAQYEGLLGSAIKTMKFSVGPKAGYNMVDIDGIGAILVEPYASTAAGTPTVETLAGRVANSVGVLKIAGTQIGSVISGDLTLTNDLELDRYVGNSNNVSLIALNGMSVDVNLTARYQTDVLRAYGALGANPLPPVQTLDVVYSLGASLSLTLHLSNIRFEPVGVPTTNGKAMTISMKGRAELDATNAMLTATLVNAHATY